MIIDAWAQHPTRRHLAHPMFDSLRRWTRGEASSRTTAGGVGEDGEWPLSLTLASMDEAGITRSLISAWEGPRGSLISNDEVAGFVREAPERLVGRRLRGHQPAARGRARDPPLRARARLPGHPRAALAVGTAAHARALLSRVQRVLRTRRPVLHAGGSYRSPDALRGRAADPVHRPGRHRLPGTRHRLRPHRLSRGPRR